MKKKITTLAKWLCIFTTAFFVGLTFPNLIEWYKMPAGYSALKNNVVFSVSRSLTPNFLSLVRISDIQHELRHNNQLTTKEIEVLRAELNNEITQYKQSSKLLKSTLDELIDQYGEQVKPNVDAFLSWQENIDLASIGKESPDLTVFDYEKYKDTIKSDLRKILGYYNINSPELVMALKLAPFAKAALKEKPNDPTLCTAMQKPIDLNNPNLSAKQIAYIDIGNQYCNKYYNKASNWGEYSKTDHQATSKSKLDDLSYKEYYNEYVLPNVPNALALFQDTKHNQFICNSKGLTNRGDRNPKEDALRVAYRDSGDQYCSPLSSIEKNNFYYTGLFCFVQIEYFCTNSSNNCDVVERCTSKNGAIIK